MGHILILGGARSGKSRFGETLALANSKNPAYIATAQAHDGEMQDRIAKHRAGRSNQFVTIEEPLDLGGAISDVTDSHDVILVDCLTLWLSNLMLRPDCDVEGAIENLIDRLKSVRKAKVILISNEVGQGIVPDNALARSFRDSAGLMHQHLANVCETVVLVTAGLPLTLKGSVPTEFL